MQVSNEIKRLGSGLRVGQHKRTCPECQCTRTKNRKDKPLSIKVDAEGVQYMCHHCGTEGGWMHNNSTIGVTQDELRVRAMQRFHKSTVGVESFRIRAKDFVRSSP